MGSTFQTVRILEVWRLLPPRSTHWQGNQERRPVDTVLLKKTPQIAIIIIDFVLFERATILLLSFLVNIEFCGE